MGSSTNFHGVFLRYDPLGRFRRRIFLGFFDMTAVDPALAGMQSAAFIAPYVYLLPFVNGSNTTATLASKIVRYDTSKGFKDKDAYEKFDLTNLPVPSDIGAELDGFTGGIVVGSRLVLVPWGSRNLMQSNSVAALFDSTKALDDPSAWETFDLTKVDPKAAGYQFGWLDKDGFVWFVPTHNYDVHSRHPALHRLEQQAPVYLRVVVEVLSQHPPHLVDRRRLRPGGQHRMVRAVHGTDGPPEVALITQLSESP